MLSIILHKVFTKNARPERKGVSRFVIALYSLVAALAPELTDDIR